jgi:hypothetical protein
MVNIIRVLCCLFVLLSTSITKVHAHEMLEQGIEVSGKSVIFATPDQFSLSISITERQATAQKAKLIIDHKTNLVVQAAEKIGIAKDKIQTAQVRLNPIFGKLKANVSEIEILNKKREKVSNNKIQRIHIQPDIDETVSQMVAFDVSRQITLSFTKLAEYDQLLDQLVKIGVTQISPLSMTVSNAAQLYQKALQQAVTAANTKAQLLAAQTGQTLAGVRYLKEQSYFAPAQQMRAQRSELMMANSSHQSLVSEQQINAEVLVRYDLK